MPSAFTRYQKFVLAVLAFLQFTIILDFTIIRPLGALLLRDLHITTRQFGLIVSVYAFSAGASGLLAAEAADTRADHLKPDGHPLGTVPCLYLVGIPLTHFRFEADKAGEAARFNDYVVQLKKKKITETKSQIDILRGHCSTIRDAASAIVSASLKDGDVRGSSLSSACMPHNAKRSSADNLTGWRSKRIDP